jgi:ribosomal protein S18 acetylase RimI-like enzyme
VDIMRETQTNQAALTIASDHPRSFGIAPAEPDDAAGIASCLAAAFEPFQKQFTALAYERTALSVDAVKQRIDTAAVLIARNTHGAVIGVAAGRTLAGNGHILGIAVVPSSQGHGVATELLDRMEGELIAEGARVVTINATAPLARAIRFYERNGYARSGAVSDFFGMRLYEFRKRVRPRSAS